MIEKLQNSVDVTDLRITISDDDFWDYHKQLTGFYKSNFFLVTLFSRKGIEGIKISDTTKEIEQFKEFIYGV